MDADRLSFFRVRQLEAEVNDFDDEVQGLERRNVDLVKENNRLIQRLAQTEDDLNQAEGENERVSAENAMLAAKVDEYRRKIIALNSDEDLHAAEVHVLEKKIKEAVNKNQALEEELENLFNDNAWYDEKVNECVGIIKVLEKKVLAAEASSTVKEEVKKVPSKEDQELASLVKELSHVNEVQDENRNLKHRLNLIIKAYNRFNTVFNKNIDGNLDFAALKKEMRSVVEYMSARLNNESFVKILREDRKVSNMVDSVINEETVEENVADVSLDQANISVVRSELSMMLEALDKSMPIREMPEDSQNQSVLLDALLNGSQFLDESLQFDLSDTKIDEGTTSLSATPEESGSYDDENQPMSPIVTKGTSSTSLESPISRAFVENLFQNSNNELN